MQATFTFTVQGRTADDLKTETMKVIEAVAPNRIGRDKPPDLDLQMSARPFLHPMNGALAQFWEADITAYVNVGSV